MLQSFLKSHHLFYSTLKITLLSLWLLPTVAILFFLFLYFSFVLNDKSLGRGHFEFYAQPNNNHCF